jgi:hypothetical protein
MADKATQEPASKHPKTLAIVTMVVALLIIAGVVALIVTGASSATTTKPSTAASTSISAGADAIIASAALTNPSGFVLEFAKNTTASSIQRSDWAVLDQPDGSEANVTVTVYSSTNATVTYFDRLVACVTGLPGYTDVTSDLASFQQYGKCYGYGEDVDSIAVINGVCTKGNVFLSVHLVSDISFSDLEGYLTGVMGALYQSAA